MSKDAKKLVALAKSFNLRVENGKKHVKVFGPDGLVCGLPHGSKTTAPRNHKGAEAAIRRAVA